MLKGKKVYFKITIALLVLLIAIPCSVKQYYIQEIGLTPAHKSQVHKISCESFTEEQDVAQSVKKHAFTPFSFSKKFAATVVVEANNITNVFILLKEKTPTYLLYEHLII